ncbi:MAG: zf-HC2 domain-containing protein [Pseudomonadota bacterium]
MISWTSARTSPELISGGMDRPLTLGERLRLRIHLMMCRGCSNFERQMQVLRNMARRFGERPEADKDN